MPNIRLTDALYDQVKTAHAQLPGPQPSLTKYIAWLITSALKQQIKAAHAEHDEV